MLSVCLHNFIFFIATFHFVKDSVNETKTSIVWSLCHPDRNQSCRIILYIQAYLVHLMYCMHQNAFLQKFKKNLLMLTKTLAYREIESRRTAAVFCLLNCFLILLQWSYFEPAGCKELKNACKMVMLQYAHVMKTCAILAKGLDLILVWWYRYWYYCPPS